MATVLSLIQQFCYRSNLPAPSTVVGVTSPAELQYLSLFKFIGDNLRNRPFNWPQLKRTYEFNTQTDVRNYQMAGDFYRLLESTPWDQSNQWPMRGPISDYNFQIRSLAIVSLQTRKAFRIFGPSGYLYNTSPYSQRSAGYFEIDPAGQNDTDTLQFEYVSANWCWPRDWVTATAYTAGDIRSGVANLYIATSSGTSGATRPNWTSGSGSDGTVTWKVYTEPYVISNDSDFCLFDDDLIIEGMRWAYLDAKGLEPAQASQKRQDWEMMVRSAMGRTNGPTRINAADEFGDQWGPWPYTPPGGWDVT